MAQQDTSTTDATISTPLQPCHQIPTNDHDALAEVGSPLPADAPRYPDLHTIDFPADRIPEIGATIRTIRHDYTGDKATDWLVVGHGPLTRCTGVQASDFGAHTAGTVYHEATDYRVAYLSPIWLLRSQEINRRMAARGSRALDGAARAAVRAELDAEGWQPTFGE